MKNEATVMFAMQYRKEFRRLCGRYRRAHDGDRLFASGQLVEFQNCLADTMATLARVDAGFDYAWFRNKVASGVDQSGIPDHLGINEYTRNLFVACSA